MPSKRKISIGLLAALFCHSTVVFGQYKFDQPVIVSMEQGLPTNDIRALKKGEDGFMWMGTSEGLCRFDGQQMKIYKPSDNDSTTYIGNSVLSVLPVGKEIWMGTTQGVSVFNTVDETFRRYQIDDN